MRYHCWRLLGREAEANELEDQIRALLAYADDDIWMVRYLRGEAPFQRLYFEIDETD